MVSDETPNATAADMSAAADNNRMFLNNVDINFKETPG